MSRCIRLYIVALLCAPIAAIANTLASSLTWQATQYFSSQQAYFREGAAKQDPSISFELQKISPRYGAIHLRDEYSAAENWNYLDVYELYGRVRLSERWTLNVGRKLETWTEWESAWGQGLFQPRYLENKLDPQAAGLTGLFVDWQGDQARAALVALPLFIPDFGPMHSVSDDQFVSANPWFHAPAPQFVFRDVATDIRYSVNRPSAESVVFNPGVAAKFEVGHAYMSRVSYAYKPMPQLLFGFPSRGKFHHNADYMSIEIGTRLRYHHVMAWDGVAPAGPWRLSASVVREMPVDDGGPEDFTSQQVSPAWIYALSASRPLEEEGPSAARVTFGFLKVVGGDALDRGDFSGQETLFERRFQYQEAYMGELSKPFRGLFSRPLVTALRVIYDRMQNGMVFSFRSGLAFNANWRADLSLDMLGLLGGEAPVHDGFLSTYRANDRVALGMSYVF
ncbi:MAG: hypothetical protein KF799_13790 [Bdellovibrionales bacterium]|nr:hypothetical protein [Bdellovibrionales bacterium]